MTSSYTGGLVTTIVMFLILCSLVLVVHHTVFGLITTLPNMVMRWIGSQVGSLVNEGDVESRTGRMVSQGTGEMRQLSASTAQTGKRLANEKLAAKQTPTGGSGGGGSRVRKD